MKETIAKVNKTKSWFLEKINKIDKPLARLMKKKRVNNQINKIKNEKGKTATDNAEIQSYIKKQEKHRICNLTLHLKQLEKRRTLPSPISRRKEIIKI